jgi:hypothetical protein
MLKLKHILIGFISFLSLQFHAQLKSDTARQMSLRFIPNWDTTKYQKFNDRLIVAWFQSYKTFNSELTQVTVKDSLGQSSYEYSAEANNISGIELNFDKINIQIGLKSVPPKDETKYGRTNYFNLGFNFGGNRWFVESAIRKYTGFYDKNTPNYDTSFKRKGNFRQLPNMSSTLTKVKFLYFTNYKKYSFRSGYACNYRQLRSAISWVLAASIYSNNQNTDSSFVPQVGRPYYRHFADLNGIQVSGLSVNGGLTFNLVLWKAWFLNMFLTMGPDQQWRKYNLGKGKSESLSYMTINGDFRMSMGLNMKKFYILFTTNVDGTSYSNYLIKYRTNSVNGNFTFGWRFAVKAPKFYKKFQETKFYKKL